MNADQIEIIAQYLKIETNYAVIISGEYGIGKTHFYKNYLAPEIRKISLPQNEKRTFIPIHIQLFGIKNVEDVQTAIFLEIYPILKNKGLKLAAGIGKSIIRGIAQIHGAGDIDKYIGDLNQNKNDWLKYNELVICFDDLDRKSQSLDSKDIFGFINSLVENEGAKILLIANEKQLLEDKVDISSLIEKVIGVSIQYKPNIEEVFVEIISQSYSSGDKLYYKFLQENINYIIQVIQINQNNFRNFIFFLEHFKTIFYPLEELFEGDKEFEILKQEKLKAILDFTLAIAFDFKSGALNSSNVDAVINFKGDVFDISKFLLKDSPLDSENEKDKKPTY